MFKNGKGVKQNYAESVRWLLKSVERGYAMSQYNLCYMYNNSEGVKQDYSEAIKVFKK